MQLRSQELPCSDIYRFCDPPNAKGESVEFRLIYRGKLPAASQTDTRRKEKHEIRKEFHKQLKELWRQHQGLAWFHSAQHLGAGNTVKTGIEVEADKYARCGYRFLPLINRGFGLACALDILFLRRDSPGNLIRSGGDIDNRIKVLFDGLRIPQTCDEVQGFVPEANENPFYVLMEDDSLITEVRVNTDRLMTPQESGENLHDVVLIIHVQSKVANPGATLVELAL
jgi:hypothetical protein